MTLDEIKTLNRLVLGRKITEKEAKKTFDRIKRGDITDKQYVIEAFLSPESLKHSIEHAQEFHLYYSHYARLKMVASLLPGAEVILDLGGANGSIYKMGYPYKFKKITVVDLPPDDRDEMYKHLEMKPQKTPNGLIAVHFGDMSNLDFAKDNSVDMVWSGESIEHVTEEAGERTIREVMRVLKPGGYFCLDTPNRAITKIHTAWRGGDFVNPDHKIEYYPGQLEEKLKRAGFIIEDKRGVLDMPNTYRTQEFDYTDYILGGDVTPNVESAYMMFYKCRKPTHEYRRPQWRKLASRVKAKVKSTKARLRTER